jgi:phosphopantetheinyl transferase
MGFSDIYIVDGIIDYDYEVLKQFKIRSHKFTDQDHKEISYKAWYFLYTILLSKYKVNLLDSRIYYKKHKPFTKGIFFNISHTSDIISVIISDKECSIDIELINDKRDINRISKRMFGCEHDTLEFYRLWTIFEAKLKMNSKKDIFKERSIYLEEKKLSLSYISYLDACINTVTH